MFFQKLDTLGKRIEDFHVCSPHTEEVDDKTSIGSLSWRETRVDGKKVGSSAPETPGIFL